MSNSIVRMEMSSISTSLCCLSFCSQLHFKSKALNKRSHRQLTNNPQSHKRKQVFMCVKLWEACVCFKLMQGLWGMRIHTRQTSVRRQQAAGSPQTFSGTRSWDCAVCCFLTSMCGMRMRNPPGISEANSFFLNVHQGKGVKQVRVCTTTYTKMNRLRYFSFPSQVCHTTKSCTGIAITHLQQSPSLLSEQQKDLHLHLEVTVTIWIHWSQGKSPPQSCWSC